MKLLIGFLFVLLPVSYSMAQCNFITADYSLELSNPKYIKSINIKVIKNVNFAKNFLRIITEESNHIPTSLKKNFKAIVDVQYDFGTCSFNGRVRQTGDSFDHLKMLQGGKPLQSLGVKLQIGNVLNAVKFKLLIPETRNGTSEVLGTILLRELGFIVPETFEVEVMVNGVKSTMLFQEDLAKEMLERNSRVEGPLFEGDESLLWSYKNFKNNQLLHLSTARLSNKKWFLKNKQSAQITLNAFSLLQDSYLHSRFLGFEQKKENLIIFPNKLKNEIFQNYFFAMLTMNGKHGLKPNNRQYYFNSFLNRFEPIYYDGDLRLLESISIDLTLLPKAFPVGINRNFFDSILKIHSSGKTLEEFKDRTLLSEKEATAFFKLAINQVSLNTKLLWQALKSIDKLNPPTDPFTNVLKGYIDAQNFVKLDQKIIVSIKKEGEVYIGQLQNKDFIRLSNNEMAEIISKKELNGQRYDLLITLNRRKSNHFQISNYASFPSEILHSPGVKIKVEENAKRITFKQIMPSDWVLVKQTHLSGWKVIFSGVEIDSSQPINTPRKPNIFGLTGCLNFYETSFNKSTIKVSGGNCEDGVNIVRSKGVISNIYAKNVVSDAVDIDFSSITIKNSLVINAGNDCFDVSGGNYSLNILVGKNCKDKGLSVGEKSLLAIRTIKIEESSVGISSKDLSKTTVGKAYFREVETCYEAKQKKQEFGGGKINFEILNCSGEVLLDIYSSGSQ